MRRDDGGFFDFVSAIRPDSSNGAEMGAQFMWFCPFEFRFASLYSVPIRLALTDAKSH
jgi:hypothetical protein